MPQNLSAKFVCPSPKVLDFNEKRLHWASVVRGIKQNGGTSNQGRVLRGPGMLPIQPAFPKLIILMWRASLSKICRLQFQYH